MVGGKNHGQKDRQQSGDAEQDPIEELAVARALLVFDGLPEKQAGEAVGKELGDERDGLAWLNRQAKHIRPIILDALGDIAQRRCDRIDAPGIEAGPNYSRTHGTVAVRDKPALDGFVGRIAEGEHEPTRAGSRCQGPDRHRAGGAIGTGRSFDAQVVTAPFVGFSQSGDVDSLELGIDLDGLDGIGAGGIAHEDSQRRQAKEKGSHPLPATAAVRFCS